MSLTELVVIIRTYNQRDKTLACLSALLGGDDIPFDVVVCDNGSQDGTLTAVKTAFPSVLTRYGENNLGVAGERNASAQIAINDLQATHILFLDNDILVEAGFVRALYEPFQINVLAKRKPSCALCMIVG